jgi:hypothetical protein
MRGIWTDVSNPVARNGDIGVGNDLARLDAYPTAVPDDQVSWSTSHGNIY